jgi:Predicted membrane protein
MDNREEIQQLLREIQKLNDQLYDQKRQIDALKERLIKLTGGPQPQLQKSHARKGRERATENFIGLKLIHFIGIIVLVIGLSIGVKYAIDKDLISPGMRVALAYLAGIVLFIVSLRLKRNYKLFSAILFSGGMASLYFTTYGAYVYYQLFPFAITFVIMIILTIYTVYQAISYDQQEIALLGLVGAYGIPFLISKNADRADLFFLYISFINVAVCYLAVRKSWKNVSRVANAISLFLFMGWVIARFSIKWQLAGTFFLAFFFILFLVTIIAVKLVHKTKFTLNDTYQLLLNNIALFVSSLFLFGYTFANADISLITICLCIICLIQALFIYLSWKDELLMQRMLLALSLIFFVLFIAFRWTGLIVTFLWLLTAVLLFVMGIVRRSVPARMAAIFLMGITLLKLVMIDSLTFTTIQKIVSYLALGILLLFVSFFYQKFKDQLFGDG